MGGFFGATSKRDVVLDVFFGVDYHSHLGTRRAGMAAVSEEKGFQRDIHNIENAPFRTKFAGIVDEMHGNSCIGCISDSDPQPIIIRSNLGVYAISTIGIINNADDLIQQFLYVAYSPCPYYIDEQGDKHLETKAQCTIQDPLPESLRVGLCLLEYLLRYLPNGVGR